MIFLRFLLFAVFCTLAASEDVPEMHTHTTCGQVLTESSGGISYKPFEPFNPDEKCVWVIRVPQAVQYTFNFYNLDQQYSVRVATIGLNQEFVQFTSFTKEEDYTTDANVLIVTYTTANTPNNNKYKGFSMWYTSVVNESSLVSPNSIDTIVSSPISSQIRHSPTHLKYSNNELSTIIFAPNFLYQTNKQIRLHYTQLGWDGISCNDYIELWEIAQPAVWRSLGKICGSDTDMLIANKNMLLLFFKSDGSGVGSGFTLDYTYEA